MRIKKPKSMIFHRSSLPSPVRYLANFSVYKKYVKQFKQEDTAHNRKWLYTLNRNMRTMGFNDGIESFETYYEGTRHNGRVMVQNQLDKMARQLDE